MRYSYDRKLYLHVKNSNAITITNGVAVIVVFAGPSLITVPVFWIFISLSFIEYSDSNSTVYGVLLSIFQARGSDTGAHLSTEIAAGDSQ